MKNVVATLGGEECLVVQERPKKKTAVPTIRDTVDQREKSAVRRDYQHKQVVETHYFRVDCDFDPFPFPELSGTYHADISEDASVKSLAAEQEKFIEDEDIDGDGWTYVESPF